MNKLKTFSALTLPRKLSGLVTLLTLATLLTIPVSAQFVAGPLLLSCVTNTAVFQVPTAGLTNLPSGQKRTIPIGQGFSFTCLYAGTNATTTTNTIFKFEVTVDGSNWDNNNLITIAAPGKGTGASVYTTNVNNTFFNHVKAIRLFSIQNTNSVGQDIFITNMIVGTKF